MFWHYLLVLVIADCALAEIRISLDSDQLDGTWILENQNKSVKTNGRVPGGVYTDLHAGGVLGDSLFYRFNDREHRWVSLDNWTYSRSFDIPLEVLGKTKVNLVFHGVDTVGEILLNGQLLGSIDNMFVRYVFPIKDIAKPTGNNLEIRLQSAVLAAAATAQAQPYPVPPSCVPDAYQGECHANLVRKMQASFSWDWGPAFPSAGLWKSVEIEGLSVAVIRDVKAVTEKIKVENITTWRLEVTTYADLATEFFEGYTISSLGADVTRELRPVRQSTPTNGNFTCITIQEFILDENEVHIWWPNGFGNQSLYQLNVSMSNIDIAEDCTKNIKVGFRTVELVQEPLMNNAAGLSFYFKVNGVPIFMKGSNWIPGHVLPELGAQPKAIRHALLSAKEAHMNMLRVWGGGVYESDLFYETADELGILIWQDMMFACSMYPTGNAYLASVRAEIEQQVRRLQHHVSVAIWAGNNENEAALRSDWYGTNGDFDRYKADYIKLYVDVIKTIVNENDGSRPYVVSSPSNGVNSEEQGYIADDPYSALFGDVHYYNYVSDGWNSATFPDTRFASEYGYQSMPSFQSLQAVSVASDWSISSNFSQLRQHHPGGYEEMIGMIKQHLPLPDDDGSADYYQKFIYFSQISQGMSTKTESERYRRDRSKLTSTNKGNTMGALYWQLNDVWEAPTWASIEFNGRWKLLHYLAKKFFAPVLVSPEVTPSGEVNVYLVSDLLEDVPNLVLDVAVMSYSSFQPKSVATSNVTLVRASSQLVWTSPSVTRLISDANCTITTCFIKFTLSNSTSELSDNFYFPASFSDVLLPSANVSVSAPTACDTCAILNITASAVAPFVWLETAVSGVFSDNGFTITSPQVEILFETRGEPLNFTAFVESLTFKDLSSVISKGVDNQNIHNFQSFFGFGQSADVNIVLDGTDTRKTAEIKTEDGKKEKHLLYYDGETVSGKVNITLKKSGGRLEHQGIKIEFIGQIELYYDRGNHHEFTSLSKELARPGELCQHATSYAFEFLNVEKPFESYTGSNVRLRYFLRVTIIRRISDIVKELELVVYTLSSYPEMNSSIKMEVGIEECLHIEFEYNKCKYHLKDVIVGKIYFLLVRIKIKHMEIAIIKRETTGSGPHTFTENETIAKYEIMDGAPVRGESIPIRVFLAGYDLTPTMREINKKFSVRYYLNLVLMDEEDRRYFKQQEITLWRKGEKTRKLIQDNLSPQLPSHLVAGETRREKEAAKNAEAQEQGGKTDILDPDQEEEHEHGPIEDMTRESPDQTDSPTQ